MSYYSMLIRRAIQNSDSCEHVFKYISTAEFPPNKILKKPMLQRVMIFIGWSWLLSHKNQVKR